ncbi:glycoside hydrolase family 172 protein [Chitinophaga sp. MM2321]|uniref:glycoside hydrolase family 172 protein n=1 Tax=Chitinophaga sp. MM2321 TaxID=3137178 RepID=UPI0032D56CAC
MKRILMILILLPVGLMAQELYKFPADADTRWITFENSSGGKGIAGIENKGAKGHPCDTLKAGASVTLMDYQGAGVINRIWLTISERKPEVLRSIRIDMYWEGATKPAVSAPLGDFFGIGLGLKTPFQCALFSDPEGRSFNCNIPMPFNKKARIVLVNESSKTASLFYEINLTAQKKPQKDLLYFHAYWNSNKHTKLGDDFEMLPAVTGKGRYLGSNMGVIADKTYGNTWFGEGEVKMYLDGDTQYPTLAGTGTEDYIGTGWSQGTFAHLYQGCLIADGPTRAYAFYRYHIPDPVYFHSGCRVTIQQIGGGARDQVREVVGKGARLKPVTVSTPAALVKILEQPSFPNLSDEKFPDGWVNFYRLDNYSSTAYFYLDKPESNLPALAPLAERLEGITPEVP